MPGSKLPDLKMDGEILADCAIVESIRRSIMPYSTLQDDTNLLACLNNDAASIACDLLKTDAGNSVAIEPVLPSAALPVHMLMGPATVQRMLNMMVWAVLVADSPS